MAHPGEICKCLDEERKNSNSNDGFYSRFLMCMPQPEFRDANVTEDTFTDAPSISRLLYAVDKLHKQKQVYMYDTEAKQVDIRYYNEQQQYLRENHSSDTYTSEPMIQSQLVRKILLYPGGSVPCNAITKSTRFTADQVKAEMKMICELGLGETKHEKPQCGGRIMFILNKISTKNLSLEKTLNITKTLSKIGINFDDYDQACNNNENTPPLKKLKTTTTNVNISD
ncbi:uncharacterized protein LOC143050905 [Mytilus galloprovincialis]|uniref:uncharacterized protein LOC143050905 n=1 Tax=Mytilus galloprovincialis TaxID=29158 RepID=UPI003F7C3E5C